MRRAILILLTAAPLVACNTEEAAAQTGGRKAAGKKGVHKDGGKYFVEFRSRYALSYGHTFLVHGRLNDKGEIGELSAKNVAGFHPMGDGPELWTVGHVVPVPAE